MKKLRIAVLGCGRIASVYEEAFYKLKEEAEIVLAMDKVLERAEKFAEKFPGCYASDQVEFDSFRQILLQVKPDLVHILLPHHLHGRYSVVSMECGVHVLTEKPVTISLAEADQLIEVRERTGMQLGVIYQNRFIEGVQEVKRRIASGEEPFLH